jgi:hypothetical protein
MSYYYEDTSHYCYTDDGTPYNPTYYGDMSSDSSYYNNTPSDLPFEPIYHDDTPTGDLVYYDDTHSEPTTHFDNTTTWSPPTLSTSYEIACELEAYAEAAANRIYTEDEIHPAYRDHPDDHLQHEPDPPVLAEPHYKDETHQAYRDHSTNDNHEDASTSEYKDYDWIEYWYENGVISYEPPADPRFYIPSSHDNSSDEDLTEAVELIGHVINEYREWFTDEGDDPKLIKKWTPHLNLVMITGMPNPRDWRVRVSRVRVRVSIFSPVRKPAPVSRVCGFRFS